MRDLPQPSLGLKPAIEQRRATRSFRSDPIPPAILAEIFQLGIRAPSGYNLQPWRFIAVRETENKEKLKRCAFDQDKVAEAPVVLICCGDRRVNDPDYIESVIQLGYDAEAMNEKYADALRSNIRSYFENKPSIQTVEAWTNRQTMIAVTHMMIVAKSFGVDSCPMEGFFSAKVKEAFNIPELVDVCCLLALGYATEPFKQYGGRFGLDKVLFGEKFGEKF